MKKFSLAPLLLDVAAAVCAIAIPMSGGRAVTPEEAARFTEGQLSVLAADGAVYGFPADTDFRGLYLGPEIPAYGAVDGALRALEVQVYPVVNGGGNLTALSAVTRSAGEITGSVATGLVEELAGAGLSRGGFALIYAADGVYADAGAGPVRLAGPGEHDLGREPLTGAVDCSALRLPGGRGDPIPLRVELP